MAVELYIDPRLQALLPKLSEEESKQLEENLIEDGRVTDPVIYWNDGEKNVIADGMNRYPLATKHRLPYRAEPMLFQDFEAVKRWVIKRCLGRRHLVDKLEVRKLRGELYNSEKRTDGGHGNQKATEVLNQSENVASLEAGSETTLNARSENHPNIAVQIAKQHGGSPSSVRRDGKLVASLNKLAGQIKNRIDSGDLDLSDVIVHALANQDKATQLNIARDVRVHGMKWAEACAQRGAEPAKPKKKAPGRPRPTQGGESAGREEKGKRTESLAPDFQPITEARSLFDRMDKSQRLQVQRMWGEWIEAAEEVAVVTTEPTAEKVESKKNGKTHKAKTGARFMIPSVAEVQAYCDERKNDIDGQEFIDYYQARGWKYKGGIQMKDWKAGVRNWEKNRNLESHTQSDPRGTMRTAKEYLASRGAKA